MAADPGDRGGGRVSAMSGVGQWFQRWEGLALGAWGVGLGITWGLPLVTGWWPAWFWAVPILTWLLAAGFLTIALARLAPLRNLVAAGGLVLFGCAWLVDPSGSPTVLLAVTLAIALVCVWFAVRDVPARGAVRS